MGGETAGLASGYEYSASALTASDKASGLVHVPQLWQAVEERIRSEILAGLLVPGSKLIESELADRFGTSRGPVREAIRELAREGLVVELPRRGTVVSTLTARDLVEVYAVREAIEIAAANILMTRASDEALGGLERLVIEIEVGFQETGDYAAVATRDFAFHRAFVALASNSRMLAITEQMLAQTALLLRTAAEANATLRSGLSRPVHRQIFDALVARNREATYVAIEAHYRYAEERLFAGFSAPPE